MFADQLWSRLPLLHKTLTVLCLALVLTATLVDTQHEPMQLKLRKLSAPSHSTVEYNGSSLNQENYLYTIGRGDTLSSIFQLLRLSQSTMYAILETDLAILALDTLKPGNQLRFWLHPQSNKLKKLEIEFNLAHRVIYERVEAGGFEYREIILPGDWQEELLAGEVRGSFYLSAKKAGLSANDIMEISALFKNKMNFNKAFRAGDQFQIVRAKQTVNGQETGATRIEGIRILTRKTELTAFLFNDTYYDKKGIGMERAFSRYPLKKKFRISSPFNPKRRHPVTRLIRPHNGTDFATPTGTPVLSTGDGIVTEVKKHPYAGLYIKIKHGQKYKTRYLHLKKAFVRKGQTVSRGQKIALSGNSGRSTGPHLHYELHINNRAVNAMRADIPIMKEIEGKDRTRFKQKVANYLQQMGKSELTKVSSDMTKTPRT